ncbi:aminotransferase class IV [Microbispora triticiradicis]|uniref:Class IV aminotransferase n=2 Tax=Microbispora TaxID=2005 RepID=A0A5R8YIN4_9ACTN|nr:aminotransferase class IV [Microbispora fusca]TLP50899.1 class IV aminotransferase [Microbispora fusca]
MLPRTEIDGRPPTADELLAPALFNYGHVTVMQIRAKLVRGLDLHLARLDSANRELFGEPLDPERVRRHIRHALLDTSDATVRVSVFRGASVAVMVTVRPPADAATTPQSLRTFAYQRPAPHIKHTGTFGQLFYRDLARRDGFDDALLLTSSGHVIETSIANLLCHDGDTFVWPNAPALPGTTMQLLRRAGMLAERRPIRCSDLPSYRAVFVTNSHGIAPVGRVDGLRIPLNAGITEVVTGLYESIPWEPI